jgi:D-threo-aldose 1-dehydrogenase
MRGAEPRPVSGRSVTLTAIGAGTASLGDVFGAVEEKAATELVAACLDSGVRYLDTAPLYGNGLSERRLGVALAELSQPDVTISTKAGRTLDPSAPDGWRFDFSRSAILRGFESSLDRLGRDRVDVLYLHDPDSHEDDVYATAWPTLQELREQGVVGAIGFGMNQWQLALRFVQRLDVDVIMLAGRCTLLDTSGASEFLPACEEAGVSVVLAGVFNSGVLIDPVDGAWFDYAPASPAVLARARAIRSVAAEYHRTLPQLALQFAFEQPAATSVVVGVGSARNLRRNLAAVESSVPEGLLDRLRADGLL